MAMRRTCMLAGALAVGPFSGVDLDRLLDTPMLVRKAAFEAEGRRLLSLGKGLKAVSHDGESGALTLKGFRLEFTAELGAGTHSLCVRASAPDRGKDSLWLSVDGKRVARPLVLSVGEMGEKSLNVPVAKAGAHRLCLTLREAPGCVISRVGVYRLTNRIPRAPMRKSLLGRHPRLFMTPDDVPRLRARMRDKRVARFYEPAGALTRKPPVFRPGRRNGGAFRRLSDYALSYLLEPTDAKLRGVLAWLEMATTYPHCGVDLDAEYFSEGVSLAYDWLGDRIPEPLRTRVRETIARQCREVYQASLNGRTGGGLCFQQNHYWFAHLSLALGAAAICGEHPEAEAWLAWAWDRFERIALTFSPDGGFHEGPAYWDYSMPTLYAFIDLYEGCTGLRVPAADAGLKGQAEFRFHHLHPGLGLSAALEDSKTTIGRPAPYLMTWEAGRFRDPVSMGMAEKLVRSSSSSWRSLLWLRHAPEAREPFAALPLAKRYPDIHTVFARTSWSADATHVAFVCRPLGGSKWAELCAKYDLGGTGHNHPAQGHFMLFGRGAVLAADPGYTYEKRTRNHNTVLVDGKGQYGDGEMWPHPQPGRARLTRFVTKGDVTIAAGDAVSAYPKDLGLTRFERTLVMAGPDLVVVCDRLAAAKARTFSWLLHHYGRIDKAGARWTITRDKARLTVAPLAPDGFEAAASTYRPQYVHPRRNLTPKQAEINLLELKVGPTTETTFLVPLLVGRAGGAQPAVHDASTPTALAVRVGDTLVAVNRGAGEMRVDLPSGKPLESPAAALVARLRDGRCEVVTAPQ